MGVEDTPQKGRGIVQGGNQLRLWRKGVPDSTTRARTLAPGAPGKPGPPAGPTGPWRKEEGTEVNAISGQNLRRPRSKPPPHLTLHPTFVLICLYIFCGLSPWMKIVPYASVPRPGFRR